MRYAILLVAGAAIALIGCKPPTIYDWGNYEGSLYTLMKNPTSMEKYGKSLVSLIQDAEGSGRVPPGIYAEYGYFLYVTNQPGEAVKYFEKEKQRWPESARLMDKMISNGRSPNPNRATPTPPAVPAAAPGKDSL